MNISGNIDIQGNANIGRNANVGADANINGNVNIGHNVRVKGWLDAANIKGAMKGLYSTEDSLIKAYPRPEPGWFALVGDTLPAAVWREDRGDWRPTGAYGGEMNLWLDHLEEGEAENRSKIAGLRTDLEAETAAREADMEATERSLSGLRTDLEAETAAREADMEATERSLSGLRTDLEAETAAREADTAATERSLSGLRTDLEAETAAREADMEATEKKIEELHRAIWPIELTLTVAPTIIEVGVRTTINASWTAKCKGENILSKSIIYWRSPGPEESYAAGTGKSSKTLELTSSAPEDYKVEVEVSYSGMRRSVSKGLKAVYPSYLGVLSAQTGTPTASEIEGMTKLLLGTRGITRSGINLTNQKICFAYPEAYGALVSVKDGNNFETLTAYNRTSVSIDGVTYYCYIMKDGVTATGVTQTYS